MNKTYFKKMLPYLGVSVVFLLGGAFLRVDAILGMALALAPLGFYHYSLARKALGLTQLEIDSIYYYGFLVTVCALAVCAFLIATGGGATDVNVVIYQFGAGLVATGYAVFARMHLTSLVTIERVSPEEVMDKYILRSQDLLKNIEVAAGELERFSKAIVSRTVETSEAVRDGALQAMEDAADAFAKEIEMTLSEARTGLQDVKSMVSDVAFAKDRADLTKEMRRSVTVSTAMNEAFEILTVRSREGIVATEQAAAASKMLNLSMGSFSQLVRQIGGEDGDLMKSSVALGKATQAIDVSCGSVNRIVASLDDMADSVGDSGQTFKQLRTLTKKATEQITGLAEASGTLGAAIGHISSAATATDALAGGIERVSHAIPALYDATSGLTSSMSNASHASQRLGQELAGYSEHTTAVTAFGTAAAEGLGAISRTVLQTLFDTRQMASQSAVTVKAIEGAERLLTSASALHGTLDSLDSLFGGLTTAVEKTRDSLFESSDGIKESIRVSTTALEADVVRSSRAASDLTRTLLHMAKAVNDRVEHRADVA